MVKLYRKRVVGKRFFLYDIVSGVCNQEIRAANKTEMRNGYGIIDRHIKRKRKATCGTG